MMLQNHLPKCTFQVPEHHAIVRCLVFGTRSHRRLAAHSTNLKKVSAFECLCILEPMLNTWSHDACKPLMLALLRGMLCQISWDHGWPRKNIDDRWWQWGALLQPFPRGELCLTTMGLSKERYNHRGCPPSFLWHCCDVFSLTMSLCGTNIGNPKAGRLREQARNKSVFGGPGQALKS